MSISYFFNKKIITMKPNLLNSIKVSRPKMSGFDLSHDKKLSCNMGQLIPVACMEVVPSDKIRMSEHAMVRLAPMVAPMMHRCDVSFHRFFVPNRILWPNWEKWITNQKDELGNLPAHPTLDFEDDGTQHVMPGSLADYLGLPLTSVAGGGERTETVSALPFAAYQLIYNEYYRDQNQIQPIDFELIDGDNETNRTALTQLRKRAWEHDYFTAAAPTAQQGDAVSIPVEQNFSDVPVRVNLNEVAGPTVLTGAPYNISLAADTPEGDIMPPQTDDLFAETSLLNPNEPTTINDLRTAFRLQEWLEKSMRGGRRLFENILIFFGLRSPDSRLQRPEYIGGTKSPIQVSEVLNTTGTEDAPQGQMAGHGISVISPKTSEYKIEEWGYVITIMSILPKTAYQQGIPKHFLKFQDPMQIYWPQFDHLGEQEILNVELYAYKGDSIETFGYIPRYAEYKFHNSTVAGLFRTNLNFWHMGRIFDSLPALNQQFIEADPTHRVFAVTDPEEHKLWCHVYNDIKMIRPMSKFSTPTF